MTHRVTYLNLTDCSTYETYVKGKAPIKKGFKIVEIVVA